MLSHQDQILIGIIMALMVAGAVIENWQDRKTGMDGAGAAGFLWIIGAMLAAMLLVGAVFSPARAATRHTHHYHRVYSGQIVAHPPGCPRRAFCGCGAAVKVFGRPMRSLWLAANWFRFPRTSPAPGMVAVRRHHVFVLESDLGGGLWQVYDANSGGHLTRVHPRSLAGYVIVNPRGG